MKIFSLEKMLSCAASDLTAQCTEHALQFVVGMMQIWVEKLDPKCFIAGPMKGKKLDEDDFSIDSSPIHISIDQTQSPITSSSINQPTSLKDSEASNSLESVHHAHATTTTTTTTTISSMLQSNLKSEFATDSTSSTIHELNSKLENAAKNKSIDSSSSSIQQTPSSSSSSTHGFSSNSESSDNATKLKMKGTISFDISIPISP